MFELGCHIIDAVVTVLGKPTKVTAFNRQTFPDQDSLLDNCLIAYGSGIRDGNAHDNGDLPILLAGRGGGVHKPGQHIRYATETPLANLWLSMLHRMDVPVDRFGDSTGRLSGI